MAISLTRLSGGNTPADGSDPRTFPAIWNASATAIEGALADTGASVTVSETAPVSPTEGDLWLNSTEAKMYVYYDDGTSEQWVAAVGGTVPQQGKILQVVSTTKSDTQASSSTSFTAVTGLSASITPSSASNKVLVTATLYGTRSSTGATPSYRLTGGNAGTFSGDAGGGSQPRAAASGQSHDSGSNIPITMTFLDSPATTSSVTYGVEWMVGSGGTAYIGRTINDGNDANSPRISASITVMEVAA